MDIVTARAPRENLAKALDEVVNSAPVIVTRQNAKPVVIMSYDEYRSREETLCLLRGPANAERLIQAIAELDAGAQHKIIESTEQEIEPATAA